jgi:hypothetical protein
MKKEVMMSRFRKYHKRYRAACLIWFFSQNTVSAITSRLDKVCQGKETWKT